MSAKLVRVGPASTGLASSKTGYCDICECDCPSEECECEEYELNAPGCPWCGHWIRGVP